MSFSVDVAYNEFLAEGASKVHAIVKVTSTGGQGLKPTAEKAIVLVVDTSGSMEMPNSKIRSARKSAAAAIRKLPNGTRFALVTGTEEARCVYPRFGEGLAVANVTTRSEAAGIAERLVADGGTALSTWIDLVRVLLEPYEGAIRLAYLLTDGRNQSETPEALDAALARAEKVFQCDTRGVGEDWSVLELRRISSALGGEVGEIAEPEEMERDFRAFMERAIGRTIADVRLRVWAPKISSIDLMSQVDPTIDDLTDKADAVPPQSWDYPTGAWAGQESRQYHLCVDVPPSAVGLVRKVAEVGLVVGDDVVSQALVKVIWTDDAELSTRINREVAHFTNQEELAECVEEGLRALEQGDEILATRQFKRVLELAPKAGREDLVKEMAKLVDVDANGAGVGRPTVKIRRDRSKGAGNTAGVISRRTTRVERTDLPAGPTG